MSLLRKHTKKRYNPELKMWKEHYALLRKLLHRQNKDLYKTAHERDRLLHLITLAIKKELDNEKEIS